MDYKKIYDTLISKSKNRLCIDTIYYEKHHILPKCLGGLDDENNIVKLTPEEHYLAHLLLAKISPSESGLWFACNMMCNGMPNRNNKLYGWVRRSIVKCLSNDTKNRWAIKYGFIDYLDQCEIIWQHYINEKLITSDITKKYGMSDSNVRNSLSHYALLMNVPEKLAARRTELKIALGKISKSNFTVEQENDRINACKNYDYSKRSLLFSETRKGQGNPMFGKKFKAKTIACPICGLEGGISQMKRWHFNNCKKAIK